MSRHMISVVRPINEWGKVAKAEVVVVEKLQRDSQGIVSRTRDDQTDTWSSYWSV